MNASRPNDSRSGVAAPAFASPRSCGRGHDHEAGEARGQRQPQRDPDDSLRGPHEPNRRRVPGQGRGHEPAVRVAVDELRRAQIVTVDLRVPAGVHALAEHEPVRLRGRADDAGSTTFGSDRRTVTSGPSSPADIVMSELAGRGRPPRPMPSTTRAASSAVGLPGLWGLSRATSRCDPSPRLTVALDPQADIESGRPRSASAVDPLTRTEPRRPSIGDEAAEARVGQLIRHGCPPHT